MSQSPTRFQLLIAALMLAAGCQKAPQATPLPSPASPAPSAAAPMPEPTPSVAETPAPTPTPPPAPAIAHEGPILRLDVPPGQSAAAVTTSGTRLTLAVSAAADQPLDVAVQTQPTTQAAPAAAYRAPAMTLPFPATTGDAAARALAGPRSAGRRVLQAKTRTVGSTETFWVNTGSFTPEGDRQQTAVLKRISAHAYFYVDQQAQGVTEADLDRFMAAFEDTVYPSVTAVFGEEAKPGVDGEDKLFVVFSPAVHDFERMTDLLGYFWAVDAVPNPAPGGHSNRKEVLFMSDRLFAASPLLGYGTLAHELQHLINFTRKGPLFNYNANEATWLDEGMAMLSMEVAGYGLSAGEQLVATNIRDFENDPGAYTLQDWRSNPNGYAFGQSYLFVRYLVDRYGEGVLKEIIATPKRGAEAINEVLARRGDSFVRFFQAWTIANVLSDSPLAVGTPYRYQSLRLNGTYGPITLPGFQAKPLPGASFTATVRPWSTQYFQAQASAGQAWNVGLGAPAGGRVLGAAIAR
jgi:hypothetical protein